MNGTSIIAQIFTSLNSEAGNQAMVVPVNIQNYCQGNSSVTLEIAKMDNYSVYRRLGNNSLYSPYSVELIY